MSMRSTLLAAVVLAHLILAGSIASRQPGTVRFAQVDFNTYYAGAALWAAGQNPYDGAAIEKLLWHQGLAYISGSNYIYPPYLAAALTPGLFLSPLILGFLWYLASLGSLALALWLILRGQALAPSDVLPAWRDAFLFTCLFAPVRHALYVGQVNALLLLLVAITFLACQRGREVGAGVSLGLATLIKVSPGLLALHFLLARRFRALAAFGVTVLGLPVVTLPLFRNDLHAFFAIVPARLGQPMPHLVNQSLNGFFSRLFTANAFTEPLVAADPASVLILVRVATLTILSWVFAELAVRRRKLDRNADLSLGALITLFVIVSPFAWESLYLLLLFPVLALLRRKDQLGVQGKVYLVLSIALISAQRLWNPFTNAPADYPLLRLASPLMSLGLYGALLLLALHFKKEAWV
jgi:alpha-1,2-mannosyltransferase